MPVRLGPFSLEHPVARGGMVEVWRAVHTGSGRTVAVKVLLADRGGRGRDELWREARWLARLDHPNIATVFDVGEVPVDPGDARLVPGSPWLAIEWVGGGSLYQRPRPRTWAGLLGIARPLLAALAHAHARGVVHRDVKPANILLLDAADDSAIRHPVLTDFGLAVFGAAAAATVGGTPEFMPPEQWRGVALPESDLYAVGCVLYWLASGTTPFTGNPAELRAAHALLPMPPLPNDVPVPSRFPRLLEALLAKRAAARPGSAAEVAAALDALDGPWLPPGSTIRSDAGKTFSFSASALAYAPPDGDLEVAPERRTPALPPGWTTAPQRRNPALDGVGIGLWGARPIPTTGRVAERDTLWAGLVATTRDGRSRWFTLEGPAGVGRSHLLRWLAERAGETGSLDVRTSAEGVARSALVVLDDPTPEALTSAAGLAGRAVVVVAVGAPAPPGFEATHIRLAPLDPDAAVRLARESLRLDRVTAARVADACGGLPGLAVAIVSGWLASGAAVTTPLGLAATEAELPNEVLAPFRAAARRVGVTGAADALAAASPAPLARIAAIAGTSTPAVRRDLEALAAALPLRIAGETVSVPGAVRRALELESRARGTWAAVNGRASELARTEGRTLDHGQHAHEAGDHAAAWRALRLAPSAWPELGLLRAWDLTRASRRSRAACGEDPHDGDGLDLLENAMAIAIELGTAGALVDALQAAIEAVGAERSVALLHRIAEWAHRSGRLDDARTLWTRMAEGTGGPLVERHASHALRSLGKLAYQRGDLQEAIELGRRALERAHGAHFWAKAAFELACSFEQARDFVEARTWYAAAAATPGIDDLARASALNGLAEIRRREGDLEGARDDYLHVAALFDAHRGSQIGIVLVNVALCELGLGDLHAAEHAAARGREHALGGTQLISRIGASFVLSAITAAQARWDEHAWHAEEGLSVAATLAYVDDDFVRLAEGCARACREAGLQALADRWSVYAAEGRRKLT